MNFIYGIFTGLGLLLIVDLVIYFIRGGGGYKVPKDADDSILQHTSEWRTFVANKFINQILFWIDRDVGDVEVKLTTPYPNIDSLCLIADNMEIISTFNWEAGCLDMSIRVATGDDFICREKSFKLRNFDVDLKKAFPFVSKMRDIHDHLNEISIEDVQDLWLHLRDNSDESRDNADLFNATADLMLLMRKGKFRRNKELLRVHTELVRYVMNNCKEDFINFLKPNEEEIKGEE